MKYIIYSDCHEGSPHSLHLYKDMMKEDPCTILLGDIIDFRSCRKKDIIKYKCRMKALEDRFRHRYVRGNHCLGHKTKPTTLIEDNTLFLHGDEIFWKPSKVKEWMEGKGGKGRFSRFFYSIYKVGITGAKRNLDKEYDPSIEILEKVVNLAHKHNCKTVVCGHKHSSCDINYKSVRFVTVGRGKTEISL